MFLDAIDHVQLAMPAGGEELATWFYSDVLGIPRVPKPAELAIRGGCWFERGALRVHLGVQQDFTPATRAHPAFAVSDLERLASSIESSGVAVERLDGPDGPQVYASDPFGNRLEFRPGREVADASDYTEVVSTVAEEVGGPDFGGAIRFAQELDRLKTVERQSFILGGHRRENTVEHSWHVAMLATVLAPWADEPIDISRVIRLLLVHDIVEIDAGDTGIYDADGAETKAAREREAADRLFGLLPDETRVELRSAWEEYEQGDSAEARFARVCDRISPFLLNLSAAGVAWWRWGVSARQVRDVVSPPVYAGSAQVAAFFDAMLDRGVADGLLPSGESGLILDTTMPDNS